MAITLSRGRLRLHFHVQEVEDARGSGDHDEKYYPGKSSAAESLVARILENMDRWTGKVALVTGASSGIGEEISVRLVEHGLKVIGLARRIDKMQAIAATVTNAKGSFHPLKCDVTKENEILEAFKYIENNFHGLDILINNAGVVYPETIIDGSTEGFRNIIDVNVMSAAICIREGTRLMRKHNSAGHIINVNSVVGQHASYVRAPLSLYAASKYALNAMSLVVRNELVDVNSPIKTTNLSPGLVNTDMPARIVGSHASFNQNLYLKVEDVADAMLYILGTPPHVEIAELCIVPQRLATFKLPPN